MLFRSVLAGGSLSVKDVVHFSDNFRDVVTACMHCVRPLLTVCRRIFTFGTASVIRQMPRMYLSCPRSCGTSGVLRERKDACQ